MGDKNNKEQVKPKDLASVIHAVLDAQQKDWELCQAERRREGEHER
jgi:hypothetical protein